MRDVRYAPSSNQNVEPRGAGCAGGSGGVGGTNGERASDGCFSQKQFFYLSRTCYCCAQIRMFGATSVIILSKWSSVYMVVC